MKKYTSYKHCMFQIEYQNTEFIFRDKYELASFLGTSVKHVHQNLSHGFGFVLNNERVKVHLLKYGE